MQSGAPLLHPNTPLRNAIDEGCPLYLVHRQIEVFRYGHWIYSDSLHTTYYNSYVNVSDCLSRLVVKRTMRVTKAVHGRLNCAGSIRAKKSPSLYSVELSLGWFCQVEVHRSSTNSTLSFWYSFSRSLDVSCNSWTLRRSNSRSLSNSV